MANSEPQQEDDLRERIDKMILLSLGIHHDTHADAIEKLVKDELAAALAEVQQDGPHG